MFLGYLVSVSLGAASAFHSHSGISGHPTGLIKRLWVTGTSQYHFGLFRRLKATLVPRGYSGVSGQFSPTSRVSPSSRVTRGSFGQSGLLGHSGIFWPAWFVGSLGQLWSGPASRTHSNISGPVWHLRSLGNFWASPVSRVT